MPYLSRSIEQLSFMNNTAAYACPQCQKNKVFEFFPPTHLFAESGNICIVFQENRELKFPLYP